jgi:zinc and cadmium transporter
MTLGAQALLAVMAAALVSLVCAALLALRASPALTVRLIGFGSGALLAAAAFDLVPGALRAGLPVGALLATLLGGGALFALLERTLLRGHDHASDSAAGGFRRAAPLVLLADALHNVADGLVVGAAFVSSPATGWATAFAVAAHEIPHEAGAFALLRAAGWSARASIAWNAMSALASLAAAALAYRFLSTVHAWVPALLGAVAGSFLYVAWAAARPLVVERRPDSRRTTMFSAAAGGAAVVVLLWLLD